MNKIITIIALLLLTGFTGKAHAGDALKRFYAQHRADDNVEHLTIPKFLLWFSDNDPETRKVIRHMKSLKIFQIEAPGNKRERLTTELSDAIAHDGFESILGVTEDGERVNIYISQSRRYIRKVLITVDSKDELVVLQIKTKISFDKLAALMDDYKTGKDKSGLKKILHQKQS